MAKKIIAYDDGRFIGLDVAALPENTTPAAGDWLVSQNPSGDIKKVDVGNLPAGSTYPPQIDEYNTAGSFTWNKPAGAKMVHVICIGGGGGGGGGYVRQDTTLVSTRGGVGGASGGRSEKTFDANELGATESVDVGAGGIGGSSATTVINGATASGGSGGNTTFGNILLATGGGGGSAGGTAGAVSPSPGSGLVSAGIQTTGSLTTNGAASNRPEYASFAGGNGGGMSSANPPTLGTGGNGYNAAYPIFRAALSMPTNVGGGGGAANVGGANGQSFGVYMGTGGGGGGASLTTPRNGGNGGPYGAGGGGGGNIISTVATVASAGGAGGAGAIIVITYF